MKHPKYIIKKISMWWRGEDDKTQLLTYWAESSNDDFRPTLHPPFKTIRTFCGRHWKFLIIAALTLIGTIIVPLYIWAHTKPNQDSETKPKPITKQVHTNTSTKTISNQLIDPTWTTPVLKAKFVSQAGHE